MYISIIRPIIVSVETWGTAYVANYIQNIA
jgi:hypothetical protein